MLVMGSGGGGSRIAIEVARNGLKVLVAGKGGFTKCGATVTAALDINLPSREAKELFGLNGDMADTAENFAQDMFMEGKYMNNEEVVLAHCSNAAKYIKELVDWGFKILAFHQAPGHRFPRGILSTGRSMVTALKRGMKPYKIDFADHTMFTNLLTKNGRVVGAVGINILTGDFIIVKAKAVVLATGGAMRLYPITTAPEDLTGDGLYMAYQVGAELVDMEFPLFLPSTLYWPESMKGVFGLSYSLGAKLECWWLNKFGVRFMRKWDPVRMEMGTTRDIAAIAQATEIIEGRGGPHGGIFVSFKHLPSEILKYVKTTPHWAKIIRGEFDLDEFNVDPEKVAYEAGPASHYWNGGIKVNGKGETNVPGLYAAGEVQGGTMGANRLSGNGVTECLVFGALAGSSAADYAKSAPPPEIDKDQVGMYYERAYEPLTRKDGFDVYETRQKMQDIAFKYIGPIREESGLATCLEEVEKMKKEVLPNLATKAKGKVYNREWVVALENDSLLQVLEIVARASVMRKESRGAMYRRDYPDTDNNDWLKNIIVKNKAGQVSLETKPVVTTKIALPKREKIPYMVPDWKFEKKM